MFMNFMDYSQCRYFFTKRQVERMRRYVLNNKPFLQSEPVGNANISLPLPVHHFLFSTIRREQSIDRRGQPETVKTHDPHLDVL
jgi:hypothetical protein